MEYNPFSPQYIQNILKSNGLWLSKERGQNYLTDRTLTEKIVEMIPNEAVVFEVGSGLGALTHLIALRQPIYSIEIDRGIYEVLSRVLQLPNLTLIHADFLKYNLDEIKQKNLYFVSNLPYSISGEAVKKFIESPQFQAGIVMVQKEFQERMTASPRSPNYGVLAILSQTYLKIETLFTVGRKSFFPAPTVDSIVVQLTKKDCAIPQEDFKEFLRGAFQSRRKTIYNNLKAFGFSQEKLESLGCSPQSRPEEIPVGKWSELFMEYNNSMSA